MKKLNAKDELIQVYRTALATAQRSHELEQARAIDQVELRAKDEELLNLHLVAIRDREELGRMRATVERVRCERDDLRTQLDEELAGSLAQQQAVTELIDQVAETRRWLEAIGELASPPPVTMGCDPYQLTPRPARCLNCGGERNGSTWICPTCCRDCKWGQMVELIDAWNGGARDFPRSEPRP